MEGSIRKPRFGRSHFPGQRRARFDLGAHIYNSVCYYLLAVPLGGICHAPLRLGFVAVFQGNILNGGQIFTSRQNLRLLTALQ